MRKDVARSGAAAEAACPPPPPHIPPPAGARSGGSGPQLPLAIAFSCLGALCFTLNDTVSKVLLARYDVTVIILLRGMLALLLLPLLARLLGQRPIGRSPALWLHALRGALGLGAAWLYILGLRSLSVAEVTVLVFASPLLVITASVLLLGERVNRWQWMAALMSFVGVVVAQRPGAAGLHPDAGLVLGSAVLYAAVAVLARWLPKGESLWQVSFYGALFSALFVAPFALGQPMPLQTADIGLFLAAALFSSFGIGLGSLAYRMAAASDLAPFGYSGLLWSALVTFVVWGAVPGGWTLAGMAIIASSGACHYLARGRQGP